jgi:hypothetical protein
MRMIALFAFLLLFLGCLGEETADNATNLTKENLTNVSVKENKTQWKTFNTTSFSFHYPSNMVVDKSTGIFTGKHELNGQTGEILVVVYFNTSAVYGENQDLVYQKNPSKAASDLLQQDERNDTAAILSRAYEVGEASTYAISRDAHVAEAPFKIRFTSNGTSFTGYALDLYSPERSLHTKVRVIAKDPQVAKNIRDRFVFSFRLE